MNINYIDSESSKYHIGTFETEYDEQNQNDVITSISFFTESNNRDDLKYKFETIWNKRPKGYYELTDEAEAVISVCIDSRELVGYDFTVDLTGLQPEEETPLLLTEEEADELDNLQPMKERDSTDQAYLSDKATADGTSAKKNKIFDFFSGAGRVGSEMLDTLLLGGMVVNYLVSRASKRLTGEHVTDKEVKVTENLRLRRLRFGMRTLWFLSFVVAAAFTLFNVLTFIGLIAAPFAFMAATASSLGAVLFYALLFAPAAVLLSSAIIGGLYGLTRALFLESLLGRNYTLHGSAMRTNLIYDLTNFGTLVGLGAAALLITAFVLTTLGLTPAVAGFAFASTLTSLFGSSFIAGMTATTLFSAAALLAGRVAAFVVSWPLAITTTWIRTSKSTAEKSSKSLLNHYDQLRNFLIGPVYDNNGKRTSSIKPTHPKATFGGAAVGAIAGATAFTLMFIFAPSAVAVGLAFWGPLMVGAALVLSGTFLGAVSFAGLAEHRSQQGNNNSEVTSSSFSTTAQELQALSETEPTAEQSNQKGVVATFKNVAGKVFCCPCHTVQAISDKVGKHRYENIATLDPSMDTEVGKDCVSPK